MLSASDLFILSCSASIAAILCAALSLNTFAAVVVSSTFFFVLDTKLAALIPSALRTASNAFFSSRIPSITNLFAAILPFVVARSRFASVRLWFIPDFLLVVPCVNALLLSASVMYQT
jgi:hypothetical protein